MEVKILPPAWYPFHDDPDEVLTREVTSVGVWTFVAVDEQPKYFVALEQADKEIKIKGEMCHPWEIPSGKVEEFEGLPEETGSREFEEELGIEPSEFGLKYLSAVLSGNGASVLYYTIIDFNDLGVKELKAMDDGTLIFEPNPRVNREEISRIALIPVELIGKDTNLLNAGTGHRRETTYGVGALLKKAWIETESVNWLREGILAARAQAAQ